jgi:tetratricopeptide (TPR) repeat protein
MRVFNFEDIIKIARKGSNKDWDLVKTFLSEYNGNSDDILGVKFFLQNNNHTNNRKDFVKFISEIESAKPQEFKSLRLIKIPSWVIVAAASVMLVVGLIINHYVHRFSIHIIEEPLPVYLSDENLLLNKGMAQYKKGDYKNAAETFSKFKSDTGLYYAAICFELIENYTESIKKLKQVPENSVYYTKSLIRLAAIYTELNYTNEAKSILNNLAPVDEIDAQRIKSIKVRLK